MWNTGSIWNKIPIQTTKWLLELTYTSSSSWPEIGDGMALWLLPKFPNCTGWHHSYGGPPPNFQGLMIAIDTFKHFGNGTLPRSLNQSVVLTVNNLAPKHFDYDSEGHDLRSGICTVTNRYWATPDTVSKMFIQYHDKTLTVHHTDSSVENYQLCMTVTGMKLSQEAYLGISASSGFIIGEFNIHSFKFYQRKETVDDAARKSKKLTGNSSSLIENNCRDNAIVSYAVAGVAVFFFFFSIVLAVLLIREKSCKVEAVRRDLDNTYYEDVGFDD